MSLSRHNDELLDGLKSYADRLLREKQKAHDAAEHYKHELEQSEEVKQQILEEVSKNAKLIATQRVKIQEGECNLKRVQDKMKVMDTYQRSLQEQLASLEGALTAMSNEHAALRTATTQQLAEYESAVKGACMHIDSLKSQLTDDMQKQNSLQGSLRQQVERQQEMEDAARNQLQEMTASKAALISQLDVIQGEKANLITSLEDNQQKASKEKERSASKAKALSMKIEMLQNEAAQATALLQEEKEARAQDKLVAGKLEAEVDGLTTEMEKLQATSEAKQHEMQQKVDEVTVALAELHDQHVADIAAIEDLKAALESEIAAKHVKVGKFKEEIKEHAAAAQSAEEMANKLKQAMDSERLEFKQQVERLEAALKEHEDKYWAEKDKLKKLQDAFAEQYELLGQTHAKESKALQAQVQQRSEENECLAAEVEKQQGELERMHTTVAQLEASRITAAAVHSAQLDEAASAKAKAVNREHANWAAKQEELLQAKASLESQLADYREAAAKSQHEHQEVLAEIQKALGAKVDEADNHKEELAQKNSELAALHSSKVTALQELAQEHEASLNNMLLEHHLASSALAEANKGLGEHIDELEAKLADVLKQVAAKEDSLDTMRTQARMRENRLADLASNLEAKEELLKCISSAAAAAKKAPAKVRPRPMPAAAQPSRFHEQEQAARKRQASKKRKVLREEPSLATASEGIENLRQHQQQQERLAIKTMGVGRRSGKSIFSSMSAEPAQQLPYTSAARLFGTDIANPYSIPEVVGEM